MADRIVVNSHWAQQCLAEEGIPREKVSVIPLAYEPPAPSQNFERTYPDKFTSERPLRVLFLGQGMLLKGIQPFLDAVQILTGKPVEFSIVGKLRVAVSDAFLAHPQIRWVGPVSRSETAAHYRAADLFAFPSYCDGFGLTQLEAQFWKLPVIASKRCGSVVTDGHNGLLLDQVTGRCLAEAIDRCLDQTSLLPAFSAHAVTPDAFSLDQLQSRLMQL
jgi:glycosyltransferase involved in cell wall biosynthesis